MFYKIHRYLSVVLLAAVFVCGCKENNDASQKPVIVVSVLPQAYLVERIAGDSVEVMVMIPPGAGPSTYEPTMKQMAALARATLYLALGHKNFPFEKTWLGKMTGQYPKLEVVDASAGSGARSEDPHEWVSLRNAKEMASKIAAALGDRIPTYRARFENNLELLLADIDQLDKKVTARFKSLKNRRFYVFHSAWGHLAKDYGLEQVAVEHGHREPSSEELRGLVEKMRADGTKTIFYQPQNSPVSADVLAREIGGRAVAIDPLPRDWLKGMEAATNAIAEALDR